MSTRRPMGIRWKKTYPMKFLPYLICNITSIARLCLYIYVKFISMTFRSSICYNLGVKMRAWIGFLNLKIRDSKVVNPSILRPQRHRWWGVGEQVLPEDIWLQLRQNVGNSARDNGPAMPDQPAEYIAFYPWSKGVPAQNTCKIDELYRRWMMMGQHNSTQHNYIITQETVSQSELV